jgi:hypothetical protein
VPLLPAGVFTHTKAGPIFPRPVLLQNTQHAPIIAPVGVPEKSSGINGSLAAIAHPKQSRRRAALLQSRIRPVGHRATACSPPTIELYGSAVYTLAIKEAGTRDMVLFESPVFSRYRDAYLTDDEYLRLQLALISQPTSGNIVPGSGGLRKLRWRGSGRGKRGGIRIIYYYIAADEQIYLLTVYAKAEMKDLTRDQIQTLRKLVETELK